MQNALNMSEKERVRKLERDLKYVKRHTAEVWASNIAAELEKVSAHTLVCTYVCLNCGMHSICTIRLSVFAKLGAPEVWACEYHRRIGESECARVISCAFEPFEF